MPKSRPPGALRALVCSMMGLVALLALACQGPPGGIDPDALAGALPAVLDRHDLYVATDPGLDELERETYLATSAGLRDVLQQALDVKDEALGRPPTQVGMVRRTPTAEWPLIEAEPRGANRPPGPVPARGDVAALLFPVPAPSPGDGS